MIPHVTPSEVVAHRDEWAVLDVREASELKVSCVPIEAHIPLHDLEARLGELDRTKHWAVLCRSGRRSYYAAEFLLERGYRAANITGGILQWSDELNLGLTQY